MANIKFSEEELYNIKNKNIEALKVSMDNYRLWNTQNREAVAIKITEHADIKIIKNYIKVIAHNDAKADELELFINDYDFTIKNCSYLKFNN